MRPASVVTDGDDGEQRLHVEPALHQRGFDDDVHHAARAVVDVVLDVARVLHDRLEDRGHVVGGVTFTARVSVVPSSFCSSTLRSETFSWR